MRIAWHDTADAALAKAGLALGEEQRGRARLWWLERLDRAPEGETEMPSPPGVAPSVLAQADRLELLGRALPEGLRTAARFEATRRNAAAAGGQKDGPASEVGLELLEGTLHTARADRRMARLRLSGPPDAVFALADQLLADLPCTVPPASLAAEALGSDAGEASLPGGPPVLPSALAVGEALAWLVASLARTLVMLAPRAASGDGSEPVHQMRVALRRLRTAMTLLKPLLPVQAVLAEASSGLRTLARALAPAREWDVFLEGPAPEVAAAFPEDAALARLLKAAHRRREVAYAALRTELEQGSFRRLVLHLSALAVLQPWRAPGGEDEAAGTPGEPGARAETGLAEVAPALLQRRYKKLLAAASDIASADAAHLHAIRLRAKRLRYAGELLSPLFARKEMQRFLRRLARLQDRLGIVNDAVGVDRLLGELGAAGRGEAGGIVRGFVAATALREREEVAPAWRKFRKHAPFWT